MNNQSEVEFIDSIVVSDSMDDHEGERTVDAIPNVHSIGGYLYLMLVIVVTRYLKRSRCTRWVGFFPTHDR